jgi:hypothetical protein
VVAGGTDTPAPRPGQGLRTRQGAQ